MTHLATALLTAVIVFTPGHAFAQATAAPASPDQIIALERARQEAFVRGDVDFLDRQTSEDYTTVNGSGALSTKPEMMKSLRAGVTKVKSFELAELKARVYGNSAVLTGIYRDESSVRGRERKVNVRFMRIFVNEAGTWRAVAYQQTPF
jgi:hypothetical protein